MFLLVLLIALGFAWNKGYIQQISQKFTARTAGQTGNSQMNPAPAPSEEQKPEPAVK